MTSGMLRYDVSLIYVTLLTMTSEMLRYDISFMYVTLLNMVAHQLFECRYY